MARTQARAGIARSGCTRLEDFDCPRAYLLVAGTNRTASVGQSITITETETPHAKTCTFLARGFKPAVGSEVVVAIGSADNRLFGGRLLTRRLVFERDDHGNVALGLPAYQCEAVGYAWDLHARLVTGAYPVQSATTRVVSLVQTWAPTVLIGRVEAGLGNVEARAYDGSQTLFAALEDLAEEIGARCYVDDYARLVFEVTAAADTHPTAITDPTQTRDLWLEDSFAQIATRAYLRVSSGSVYADVAAGATSLALTGEVLSPDSGVIVIDKQWITYTGRTPITPPSRVNFTGVPASGAGAITAAIAAGASATVIGWAEDVPAQVALAAVVGGDGIRSVWASDRSANSSAAVTAILTALLARDKDGQQSIGYTTRERHHHAGRQVGVTLTVTISADPAVSHAINDTFTIQNVTLTDFGGAVQAAKWPLRTVTAGTPPPDLATVVGELEGRVIPI